MPQHPDLFVNTYPNHPGFRDTDTSRAAAEAVKPKASYVQARVIEALKVRPMTSFEIAAHLRFPYERTQPRLSELSAKGLVQDSGARGISRDPTKTAIVWRLVQQGNQPEP